MKIIEGSSRFDKQDKPLILTIGNFDGVHIGHQKTIRMAIEAAREQNGHSAVMLFDPHPRTFFNPSSPQQLITTIEQRKDLIEELGIDLLIIEPFDASFAKLPPAEFIEEILVERLGVSTLYVSSKFRFGKDAAGDISLLQSSGEGTFTVAPVENVYFRHTVVSSSFIRSAILDGEMELVRHMLGRPYTLSGEVYPDTQRGSSLLNTPTSNIKPVNDLVPALGIYASVVELNGIRYPSATYIGTRPTFDGQHVVIETHLVGFDGSLYGKEISIELFKKNRADARFTHLRDLLKQIRTDIDEAIGYLRRHREDPQVGELNWEE